MTEVNTLNYGNVLTNEKYCHFCFMCYSKFILSFRRLEVKCRYTIKGTVIILPVGEGGEEEGRRFNLSNPLRLCEILIIRPYGQSIFMVPHLYSASNDIITNNQWSLRSKIWLFHDVVKYQICLQRASILPFLPCAFLSQYVPL